MGITDIRDDILKPASTRSKIVVTLRIPDEVRKKDGRDWNQTDEIIYDLDPYDKVRMRLLKQDEQLYEAFKKTIE